MERFTGGCRCGDVRFVAKGQPYRVGICHCLHCRKHHGALFYAAAVFPAEAVTIELHLGSLDAPDQLTPTYESWVVRRESWLPPFPSTKLYERDRDTASRFED